jgi:cell division protein FtsL
MKGKGRRPKPARRPGWTRAAGWLLLLLVSLLMVTWRQTRGLAMERELRELESERAVTETERVELVRRIEELRSRARIVRVARERLQLHLPTEAEIVFLPVDAAPDEAPDSAEAR